MAKQKIVGPLVWVLFLLWSAGGWTMLSRAQSVGSWESLSGLRAGQKLQVVDTASQQRTVSFISVTGDALRVKYRDRELEFKRSEIEQVSRVDSRMGRRITYGLALGLLAGLVVGICADAGIGGNEGGFAVYYTGIGAGTGAAIGAGVGAGLGFIPRHKVLYRKGSPAPR